MREFGTKLRLALKNMCFNQTSLRLNDLLQPVCAPDEQQIQ